MTTLPPLRLPQVGDLPGVGTPIDTLAGIGETDGGFGARLRRARELAAALRNEFPSTGMPDAVDTFDLVSLPYPTRFGLWRSAVTPAPFLTITNRMLIVRWTESDATPRILLWEPSDVELDANTPYFAELARRMPDRLRRFAVREHGDVLGRLREAGVDPADVDYLAFDHLHTQDVRRWLGTTEPQADISPDRAMPAAFPRARLIVQRDELAAMADLHPLQLPWYQPRTFADLPADRLLPIDGDVLLGPGVALLSTPGHVFGNQSLLLHTATGLWASSENVIAAECLTPEVSRIPGLCRTAQRWGREVVLNANTIETTAEQYNSIVVEKTLVDRSIRDGRFLQFFPSSELTRSRLAPGAGPTFSHGGIRHRR
ncbi:MAG TPA: hypothetical protein VNG13_06750 [Mycobacteriales bacterium]|nr:hypothetical protein [Mycobacteriales bacterium]